MRDPLAAIFSEADTNFSRLVRQVGYCQLYYPADEEDKALKVLTANFTLRRWHFHAAAE
jgi:hypothetical protein